MKLDICRDTERPCFARSKQFCRILENIGYYNHCSFCKPRMDVTNGMIYKQGKEPEPYVDDRMGRN